MDAWLGSPIAMGDYSVLPSHELSYVLSKDGRASSGLFFKFVDRAWQFASSQLEAFEWPEDVVDDCVGELEKIVEIGTRGEEISVDIETRGLGLDSPISCIGFATARDACCVQLPLSIESEELVRRILASGIHIYQNGTAFDRRVLAHHGYELTPDYHDTLLAAAILDPQLPKNLGALTSAEFHGEAHKAEFKGDVESGVLTGGIWGSTDPAIERDRRRYCMRDAFVTLLVWQRQKQRLKTYGQKLYADLHRLDKICQEMRDNGFCWNEKKAKELEDHYQALLDESSKPLIEFAQRLGIYDLNLASPTQLADIYFNKFNVQPLKWSKKTGKPSLDEDVLVAYVSSDNVAASEFSKKLLEVRGYEKLLGTYIQGWREQVKDGKVHGRWQAFAAITGRFGCKDVGLMTTPASMRPLLMAAPGTEIAECDRSQLEIRTIALLADIKLFRKTYDEGGDVYLNVARMMSNKPFLERGTEEGEKARQLAKTTVLSCNYMAGDETVFRMMYADDDIRKIYPDLKMSQTSALRRAYLASVPELPKWWDQITAEVEKLGGYLEENSGRFIRCYGHPDGAFASSFKNQAWGSEIMKRSLFAIREDLKADEQILAQVHDAVVCQSPSGKRLEDMMVKNMTSTESYRGRQILIPCTVKRGVGYGEVK